MSGMTRQLKLGVVLASPLWVFGCWPSNLDSPLNIQPGTSPSKLYPTNAPLYVEVEGVSRLGPGCQDDGPFPELKIIEVSCGEGCTVKAETPDDPRVFQTLAVTASTPGWKTLEVVAEHATEGTVRHAVELEFADLETFEVIHQSSGDPGTALPMLVGMEPYWCAAAFTADQRRLDVTHGRPELRSNNDSFRIAGTTPAGNQYCWTLRAEKRGRGHLTLSAAGLTRELFPEVVDEQEIAEVHVHGIFYSTDVVEAPGGYVALDKESFYEGPELDYIVPSIDDFPLHMLVRLVTKDGRKARGGANRFRSDSDSAQVGTLGREDEPVLRLVRSNTRREKSEATCVRATIGAGKVELPVYIEAQPGDLPNPCLAPPPGEGGAGGGG